MNQVVGKVGIIGIGLMGGSLASALKSHGIEVIAYDVDETACELGKKFAAQVGASVTDVAAACDIIVVCVPLSEIASVFAELKNCGKVITDVSSVKASLIDTARNVWGEVPVDFVPGHPIAGKETSGGASADADLFKQRRVILCPLENTSETALQHITRLWECVGASVSRMDCRHHDKVLSLTSHLPHLLAYALVHYLCENEDKDEIALYSAGGFQDFTRIAESDPLMWQSVVAENRGNILAALDGFQKGLDGLSAALRQEDDEAVLEFFGKASDFKKQLKKICK